MRRLIFLLVIFFNLQAQAQLLQGPVGYGKQEKRFRALDFQGLPVKDTICDLIENGTNGTCEGAVVYRAADSTIYVRTACCWRAIAKGTGDLSDYVPLVRSILTLSPLGGGNNLSNDITLSIANAAADGFTKGASTYNASHFNDDGAGTISLDVPNGPFIAKADSAAMLSPYIRNAQNGLYKSGQIVRLGTNPLIENTDIPLGGFYLSITGNATPLGTFSNPAYGLRYTHNQAGAIGMLITNNNKAGAAAYSLNGDSAGVGGGLTFVGRDIVPDSLNAYSRPGTIQLVAGSSMNELYLRSLKKFSKIRFGIDSTTYAVIDSSNIVPNAKALRIMPRFYPEEPIEIVNAGNTIIPDSPLHRIPTGIIKNNWAIVMTHGIRLNAAGTRWENWDINRPVCAVEAGYEGVTLQAASPGRHYSDQLHEVLQARGKGIDGGATGAGTDTGRVVQIKAPLMARYTSQPLSSLGDQASWESTDNRPFIWLMSEESKLPEGEYMRIEQCAPTATGGQFFFRKSRGTMNARTAGNSGDAAGFVTFSNYDGANYVSGARIGSVLEANASAGSSPTALRFDAGSSAGTLSERMRVTSGGNLLINTTSTNGSKITVNGATAFAITTVTANTTLDNTHRTVRVTTSGVTITLPAANTVSATGWGRTYTIINYNSGGTINISTVKNYDGTDITTLASGTAITVQADFANNLWYKIN